MKTSVQLGFSLLEAIIAMTILATSGLALFGWVSQSYSGMIRVEEAQARHQLMDDLDAYFRTLNVPGETSRQLVVNDYDVRWQSRLIEPLQRGRSTAGAPSNFELGLYRLDIEISQDNRLIGEYQTRLVGYRSLSSGNNVNPG